MVLIVDDHPDTCDMLKRMLARKGYDADVCHSGDAALSRLQRRNSPKPDVIILDEMMPGHTGLETFRHLKSDPTFNDVPVVFYSAGFEYQKHQEALRLGAKAWLIKGVNRLDELVNTVAQCATPA